MMVERKDDGTIVINHDGQHMELSTPDADMLMRCIGDVLWPEDIY